MDSFYFCWRVWLCLFENHTLPVWVVPRWCPRGLSGQTALLEVRPSWALWTHAHLSLACRRNPKCDNTKFACWLCLSTFFSSDFAFLFLAAAMMGNLIWWTSQLVISWDAWRRPRVSGLRGNRKSDSLIFCCWWCLFFYVWPEIS